MTSNSQLVVYVDVDDTMIRSAGTKTMPIPSVVQHVKELASCGAQLYCWSTAGAEYAQSVAQSLGVERCFVAFLPKPNIIIDDQEIGAWRQLSTVHPMDTAGKSVDNYRKLMSDRLNKADSRTR
jgi:hypothetical protein